MYHRFRSAACRLWTAPLICMASAPVIGWKRARDNRCVQLVIDTSKPNNLNRDDVVNRDRAKFCAQEAFVLRIVSCDNPFQKFDTAYTESFQFKHNELVQENNCNAEKHVECALGILFFLTPLAARVYKQDYTHVRFDDNGAVDTAYDFQPQFPDQFDSVTGLKDGIWLDDDGNLEIWSHGVHLPLENGVVVRRRSP